MCQWQMRFETGHVYGAMLHNYFEIASSQVHLLTPEAGDCSNASWHTLRRTLTCCCTAAQYQTREKKQRCLQATFHMHALCLCLGANRRGIKWSQSLKHIQADDDDDQLHSISADKSHSCLYCSAVLPQFAPKIV